LIHNIIEFNICEQYTCQKNIGQARQLTLTKTPQTYSLTKMCEMSETKIISYPQNIVTVY